jgi:hypothetical protein
MIPLIDSIMQVRPFADIEKDKLRQAVEHTPEGLM